MLKIRFIFSWSTSGPCKVNPLWTDKDPCSGTSRKPIVDNRNNVTEMTVEIGDRLQIYCMALMDAVTGCSSSLKLSKTTGKGTERKMIEFCQSCSCNGQCSTCLTQGSCVKTINSLKHEVKVGIS